MTKKSMTSSNANERMEGNDDIDLIMANAVPAKLN